MTELDKTIDMIKAVADKNRMRIVLMLSVRPLCVCEIDSTLGIALPTISAHLKQMRSAGVINSEKDGRWVIYSLADEPVIRAIVDNIKSNLSEDPQIISDLEKINCLCRESCAKK